MTRTPALALRVLLALAVPSGVALAEEPGPAKTSPAATLTAVALGDQHGAPHRVDETTRSVLFTSDMDAGGVVKEALAEGGAERLARAGAVYVSDVSRMPGIIRSTMAEPSMRKRPYPILLDREGDATKDWPRTPGQATLLVLDRLAIVRSERLATPDAVRSALDALATPAAP